jgi:hypothetical protein
VTFTFNEKESKTTDNSANLDFSGFVDWLEDHPNGKVIDPIKNSLHRLLDVLGHPNLSTASFIVPGHASVTFSGVKFSKSGDLVFHLTYGGSS